MKDSIKRIDPLIVIAAGKHDSAACRSQRQAMYIRSPSFGIRILLNLSISRGLMPSIS